MNTLLDGAIILECTNNPELAARSSIIRALAPMAIHHSVVKRGYPACNFDYFYFWDNQNLLNLCEEWSKKAGVKKPVLITSSLYNSSLLKHNNKLYEFVKKFKQIYPDSIHITGGPIAVLDPDCDIKPDIIFSGRCLHLLDKWLEDPDSLNIGCISDHFGVPRIQPMNSEIVEAPIVPELYDDFVLCATDVLPFETRLGCKFNCTFCNFEFRNAKNTLDSGAELLSQFLQTANSKYGVKYYSCSDDTFNEEDVKLHTMMSAVETLDYKPVFTGYTRFDLLKARPWQAELLDNMGFHSHFFGIETFHRQASKIIRKGIDRNSAMEFLQQLREKYPHWWLSSGYIIGLPGEPVDHVYDVWQEIADKKIFDGAIIQALGIYQVDGNEKNFSDMSVNPEKYGLTVWDTGTFVKGWKHKNMDLKTAELHSRRVAAKAFRQGITVLDGWEAISRTALGMDDLYDPVIKQQYKDRVCGKGGQQIYGPEWKVAIENHINRYFDRKSDYIYSL